MVERCNGMLTAHQTRLGALFSGPMIPLNQKPISAEDKDRLHQVEKKTLPGILMGYALHAGVDGRATC